MSSNSSVSETEWILPPPPSRLFPGVPYSNCWHPHHPVTSAKPRLNLWFFLLPSLLLPMTSNLSYKPHCFNLRNSRKSLLPPHSLHFEVVILTQLCQKNFVKMAMSEMKLDSIAQGDGLGALWPPGGVGEGGWEGGSRGRGMGTRVCVWLIRFVVQQKLTRYCEAIILQ